MLVDGCIDNSILFINICRDISQNIHENFSTKYPWLKFDKKNIYTFRNIEKL